MAANGTTENRYVHALYAYWDEVRRSYPHLVIDNCASGGNRIDLESLSRSVFLWRNDNDNLPLRDGNSTTSKGSDPAYQQVDAPPPYTRTHAPPCMQ